MFTHLHVHTEKSLLDGAAKIKDLIDSAKEMGMDSIAITDHGNMFGVIDFWEYAKAQGIHPVLGCEVYTAARTMTDRDTEEDRKSGHLILLAENDEGYHNLMKLVSAAYTKGYYYKPRVDEDLLRQYSSGIIALSACIAGRVPQAILNNDYEKAKKEALNYVDIFGKDNFFLELQYQGLEEEEIYNPQLIKMSKELDIGLVVTNDVHYTKQEHAKAQEVLMCIQMGKTLRQDGKYSFGSDQFYLKSEDEMRKLFPEVPEAFDNTHKIAHRCN
ncbi:MAG: PHP domain-containing protein, partial [Clostridiales Family XIII bacterium]|nr:PHP domain-containing protein [Clostridiales Family XIII bacterium]